MLNKFLLCSIILLEIFVIFYAHFGVVLVINFKMNVDMLYL